MYNQYFSETHEEARRNVDRFVEQKIQPFISEWEETGSFPRELYRLAGEAGILGVGYPEDLGGNAENDVFMKFAVSEGLLRSGSGGLFSGLCSHDIALPPIVKWGSKEFKKRVVPPVSEQITTL